MAAVAIITKTNRISARGKNKIVFSQFIITKMAKDFVETALFIRLLYQKKAAKLTAFL